MESENENYEIVEYKASYLNPTEKLYVRAFLNTMSHAEAHKIATGVKHGKEDNFLANRINVQYHINTHLQEKLESLEINTEEIIKRLYSEAIYRERGSNHAARVTALSLLGKHLGMFKDNPKDESNSITYNIINYHEGNNKEPALISHLEAEEIEQYIEIPEVEIEKYE